MVKRPVTWYLVADGSRARVVTCLSTESNYEVVASYESAEAHLPDRELTSDRPGHGQESATTGRHALEPRHDPHRARKEAFIRQVATHLKDANTRAAFDALVLYADPRSLAVLRDSLDDATRAKVKRSVAKDLTKIPLAELGRHFAAES
jgi:protein required for attachment to host cells